MVLRARRVAGGRSFVGKLVIVRLGDGDETMWVERKDVPRLRAVSEAGVVRWDE